MLKNFMSVADALAAGPWAACAVLSPFEMSQIGGAELVIIGEVTGYQDLGTAWRAALVMIKVEEALKGRAEV